MGGVVRAMDAAMKSMNLEKVLRKISSPSYNLVLNVFLFYSDFPTYGQFRKTVRKFGRSIGKYGKFDVGNDNVERASKSSRFVNATSRRRSRVKIKT